MRSPAGTDGAPCACSRVTTNAARSSSSAACPAFSSPRRTPTRSRSWPGSWSDSPARRRAHPFRLVADEAERWTGGGAAAVGARRPAVRALAPRCRDRGVPQRRPRCEPPRQPGSPRVERPPFRARAVARDRSEAPRRRTGGRRRRPPPERGILGRPRRRPAAGSTRLPTSGWTGSGSAAGVLPTLSRGASTHGRWSTRSIEAARTIRRARRG